MGIIVPGRVFRLTFVSIAIVWAPMNLGAVSVSQARDNALVLTEDDGSTLSEDTPNTIDEDCQTESDHLELIIEKRDNQASLEQTLAYERSFDQRLVDGLAADGVCDDDCLSKARSDAKIHIEEIELIYAHPELKRDMLLKAAFNLCVKRTREYIQDRLDSWRSNQERE